VEVLCYCPRECLGVRDVAQMAPWQRLSDQEQRAKAAACNDANAGCSQECQAKASDGPNGGEHW